MRIMTGIVTSKNQKNQFRLRFLTNETSGLSSYETKSSWSFSDEHSILPYLGAFSQHDRGIVKEPFGRPEIGLPDFKIGDVVYAKQSRGFPMNDGAPAILLGAEEINVLGNVRSPEREVINFDLALDLILEKYESTMKSANETGTKTPISNHFQTPENIRFESMAESKKLESNTALILAARDIETGYIATKILSHKGPFFFWQEYLGDVDESNIGNSIQEPGLYLFNHGKPWSHKCNETGIYEDYGINGDCNKISIKRAADRFKYNQEELLDELVSVYMDYWELSEHEAKVDIYNTIMMNHDTPAFSDYVESQRSARLFF